MHSVKVDFIFKASLLGILIQQTVIGNNLVIQLLVEENTMNWSILKTFNMKVRLSLSQLGKIKQGSEFGKLKSELFILFCFDTFSSA